MLACGVTASEAGGLAEGLRTAEARLEAVRERLQTQKRLLEERLQQLPEAWAERRAARRGAVSAAPVAKLSISAHLDYVIEHVQPRCCPGAVGFERRSGGLDRSTKIG